MKGKTNGSETKPSLKVAGLVVAAVVLYIVMCDLCCMLPGDTGALSLRMFTEISEIFLTHEMFDTGQHQAQIKKLHTLILESLLSKYVMHFH